MEKMKAKKQTQSDLKRRKLVLPIKTTRRQKRIRQADLRIEFIINERVNLQNNKIMQKLFKKLYCQKRCKTGLRYKIGIN